MSLAVIWLDEHVVEIQVRAANGRFAGVADCYAGHEFFARAAESLRGFPTSARDHREIDVGTFDPGYAGGGARIVLRCIDSAGHAVADVTLQADSAAVQGHRESVSLTFPIEAAGVDELVAVLGRIDLVVGAAAVLRPAI
ncbi:MAG TPA: hypothetical protein VF384_19395 [Planctomycetota bacterium]